MRPRISVVEPVRMSQARRNASNPTLLSQEEQRDGAMNYKSIEEISARIAGNDIAFS